MNLPTFSCRYCRIVIPRSNAFLCVPSCYMQAWLVPGSGAVPPNFLSYLMLTRARANLPRQGGAYINNEVN